MIINLQQDKLDKHLWEEAVLCGSIRMADCDRRWRIKNIILKGQTANIFITTQMHLMR